MRCSEEVGLKMMKIFDWLDNVEVALVATVASLLLLLGPLFITYRFALAHRPVAAALSGALWLCCAAFCVRDVRRRRMSWVSGGVLILWLLTTLLLGLFVA